MKYKQNVIAAFLLTFSLLIPGYAQNPRESRLISVSGEAEVKVAPDQVDFNLAVETRNKDLRIAKNQNDGAVKNVLAFTTSYGIEPKNIQTDYLSIEPRYTNDGKDLDFYIVHKRIAIILRDISKFEGLLTGAIEAGVTHINQVQFRTTELRKYRDQARAMAIRAAQEKAIALAKELGQTVGKAHSISEDSYGWMSGYAQNVSQNVGGASPGSDSSIALGQIRVSSRVTVSFELQ
jgi:uncharacterized protein YggE